MRMMMNKNNKLLLIGLLIIPFVIIPAYAADPFDEFSFQGVLKDNKGNFVDDTVDITLSIFDVLEGGVALWSEEHDDVEVVDGIFSLDVGSVDAFNDDLNFTNALYLEVIIEDEFGFAVESGQQLEALAREVMHDVKVSRQVG